MPAALARKLGSHILTETMERRPDIGFDSYDRFFPNQDTLPHGGFGNLIALPLQKHARGDGNSVFLDDARYPASRPMGISLNRAADSSAAQLEEIVREAERRGRVLGVRLPPAEDDEADAVDSAAVAPPEGPADRGELPQSLSSSSAIRSTSPKTACRRGCETGCCVLAAFQNPEFYKAQAMRLPTYDKPRIIALRRGTSAAHRPAARLPGRCS